MCHRSTHLYRDLPETTQMLLSGRALSHTSNADVVLPGELLLKHLSFEALRTVSTRAESPPLNVKIRK